MVLVESRYLHVFVSKEIQSNILLSFQLSLGLLYGLSLVSVEFYSLMSTEMVYISLKQIMC